MSLYTYKATKADGTEYTGEFEAENKGEVYNHISEEGGSVVLVEEKNQKKLDLNKFIAKINRVKEHEKIVFAKNLSAMLEAGLAVSRALDVIRKQTKNPKFASVLQSLAEDISKGTPLNEAMAKFPKTFSKIFISMVQVGEESGNLSGSLAQVGEQMEKTYTLKKKVRGAFMYPIIIMIVMVIIAILMMVFIVPTLSATFADLDVELPLSTKLVIGTSEFMRDHYIIAFGGLIALIVAFVYSLRTKWGSRAFEWFILHMPIVGVLVKEVNSARTARTLSSLLSSGVEMVLAIQITGSVIQNSYYKEVIAEAEEQVQKGVGLSEVFARHEKLYPVFVTEMASVGEETGKISEMFANVATYYEDDVDQKTKDMSTIIEPFLMVFIGAAVGFFAISMLSPTYSLVDAF